MADDRSAHETGSSPTGHRALRPLVALFLALTAVLLIALSYRPTPSHPIDETPVFLRSLPSPTWAPMPTRASVVRTSEPLDLIPLHQALLRGDVEEAERLWRAYADETLASDAAAMALGARLALQEGDFGQAEERIWRAIGLTPQDAETWALAGVILRRAGQSDLALQALAVAEALDPSLASLTFADRWQAALSAQKPAALAKLAEELAVSEPDHKLSVYYRAEALLALDDAIGAIDVLVPYLTEEPTAPAVLWYTLGKAYLAYGSCAEAATALESAALRLAQDDQSLALVSADPIVDLNAALGRAYLGLGRCAEAETIFRRLLRETQGLSSTFESLVTQAVVCQTPTPTLTPWIPRLIGTPTPAP